MTEYEYIVANKPEIGPVGSDRVFLDRFSDYPQLDVWSQDTFTNLLTAAMDRMRSTQKQVKKFLSKFPVKLPLPNVTLTSVLPDAITASWPAVEHADGYAITILKSGDFGPTEYTIDENEYDFSGLDPSSLYTITVKALGDVKYYTDSDVATKTIITAAPLQLQPPTNIQFEQTGTTLKISWNPVAHKSDYQVRVIRLSNNQTATPTNFDEDMLATLIIGEEYSFEVKAIGNGTAYLSSAYSSPPVQYEMI